MKLCSIKESSDNQKQHLNSLDSGRLSEIGCEYDCHHKGGYWNTGYSYEQTIKYESFFVLACYIDEATLRHAHIQGRKTKKTMTFNF